MPTIAIIGDIGGHHNALRDALVTLGVDPDTGTIPAGLTIVQVGDLIHRGPDSDAVITLVDTFHRTSPDQWIQLTGNHEAQYLRPPAFTWPDQLTDQSIATLRSWWHDGWLRGAHATASTGQQIRATGGTRPHVGVGPLIITHAGVTAGLWQQLGAPTNVTDLADAINTDLRQRPDHDWTGTWRPGVMLTRRPDTSAGTLWAAADAELTTSWIRHVRAGHPLPGFHQAHGHSRPAWTSKAGLQWSPVIRMIDQTDLHRRFDPDTRTSRLLILPGATHPENPLENAMTLWGTDPGHSTTPQATWGPLQLTTPDTPTS